MRVLSFINFHHFALATTFSERLVYSFRRFVVERFGWLAAPFEAGRTEDDGYSIAFQMRSIRSPRYRKRPYDRQMHALSDGDATMRPMHSRTRAARFNCTIAIHKNVQKKNENSVTEHDGNDHKPNRKCKRTQNRGCKICHEFRCIAYFCNLQK